jgi:nucleotide-binding universal stress UspA family protein
LDGSALAEAAIAPALDIGLSLAAPERVTIHLFEVVEFYAAMIADTSDTTGERPLSPPATPASSAVPDIGVEEQALQAARDYLETVARRIQREHPNLTVTSSALLAADVAGTIKEVAEAGPGYDILAMATHGRGGLQRWAVGSITERVLHVTHRPLIIARSSDAVEHERQLAEARAEAELHQ